MNIVKKIIGLIISIPARIKGVKFGKNSFIGPGYDLEPKMDGLEIGNDVLIGRNAWIDLSVHDKNAKIIIGDGTNVGRNITMSSKKMIRIGKKCLLSYNVSLIDHDHKFGSKISPMDGGLTEGNSIEIGDNSFIGAHSFILKGVSLGKNCVVGANSVVTKSFPDYSIIGGSPAKLIGSLKV